MMQRRRTTTASSPTVTLKKIQVLFWAKSAAADVLLVSMSGMRTFQSATLWAKRLALMVKTVCEVCSAMISRYPRLCAGVDGHDVLLTPSSRGSLQQQGTNE